MKNKSGCRVLVLIDGGCPLRNVDGDFIVFMALNRGLRLYRLRGLSIVTSQSSSAVALALQDWQ